MQEPDAIPRASVPQQDFKIDHIKPFSLARTETAMGGIWGPLSLGAHRGSSFPMGISGNIQLLCSE